MILRSLLIFVLVFFVTPAFAAVSIPDSCITRADANWDGVVNTADHNIWASPPCSNPGPACGDFDWDGDADAADEAIWTLEEGNEYCTFMTPEFIGTRPTVSGTGDGEAPDAGIAWTHVKTWANKAFTSVPFCDQDNQDDMKLFAKAIAWAVMVHGTDPDLTGLDASRDTASEMKAEIEAELANVSELPSPYGTPAGDTGQETFGKWIDEQASPPTYYCDRVENAFNGDDLGTARNLAGYVHAAAIIGYRDPDFRAWVSSLLTTYHLGTATRTLIETVETRGNNFGTWGLNSLFPAATYIGRYDYLGYDSSNIDAVAIWRWHMGDRNGVSPTGYECPHVGAAGPGSQTDGNCNNEEDDDANTWQQEPAWNSAASNWYTCLPVGIISPMASTDAECSAYTHSEDDHTWWGSLYGTPPPYAGYHTYDFLVTGLIPEERRRDTSAGNRVSYAPPWVNDDGTENYEWSFLSSMMSSSLTLMAHTDGTGSGHTPWCEDFEGGCTDAEIWNYGASTTTSSYGAFNAALANFKQNRYNGGSGSPNANDGDAGFATCLIENWEGAANLYAGNSGCCMKDGTGNGFGHTGFLFDTMPHRDDDCDNGDGD